MTNEPNITAKMIEAAIYAFNDVHADEPRPSLRECFATALRAALALQPEGGGETVDVEELKRKAPWTVSDTPMPADECGIGLIAPRDDDGVEAAAIRTAAERAIKLSRDGADDDGIALKTFHAIATPETVLSALSASPPAPVKPADNLFDLVAALACAYTERDAYRSALEKINEQRYYDNPAAHEMALIAENALKTNPAAPATAERPREIVTRKYVCDGCPNLTTKDWDFYGENDDHDSGTSAHCQKADARSIFGYYRKGDCCPDWCPILTGHTPQKDEAKP